MKPRDIFRIIVATAGLAIFCVGLVGVLTALCTGLAASGDFGRPATGWLVFLGTVQIVFGLLIMMGYPPLADIAFWRDRQGRE